MHYKKFILLFSLFFLISCSKNYVDKQSFADKRIPKENVAPLSKNQDDASKAIPGPQNAISSKDKLNTQAFPNKGLATQSSLQQNVNSNIKPDQVSCNDPEILKQIEDMTIKFEDKNNDDNHQWIALSNLK